MSGLFPGRDLSRRVVLRLFWGRDFLQEFGCRNFSQIKTFLFECCDYFGVKTPCSNFSFANRVDTLRWKLYGFPTDGSSKSDFEISCPNRSFLSSSVADFMFSVAFVRNSFLRDFLQPFCISSSLRWLCSLMSLSFCMDFLHPFELLLFPAWFCVRP